MAVIMCILKKFFGNIFIELYIAHDACLISQVTGYVLLV